MEHETIDGDKHTWLDGRPIKRIRAYNEKYLFFKKSDGCWVVMEGYQGLEAAALLNVHRQSVSTYVNHFNQGGMDQLLERKSAPGRSQLSATEEKEVKRWLTESTPAKEGFGSESYWDTRVLQHVLEERFSIAMSRNGITDMLHRWGFRYTRPTYRLEKADSEKQESFQRDLDMVKKLLG